MTNEETKVEEIVTEDTVFDLLAGYVDGDGTVHTEFTVREMTGKDEEALQKVDVRNSASKATNLLLARCVTRIGALTKQIVGADQWNKIIRDLLVPDQDYILMKLRVLTKGEEIEVVHSCPNCGAKIKTVFEVDELPIVPFSGKRSLPFDLPKGYVDPKGVKHTKGTMRMPNGLDREVLMPLVKTNLAKAQTVLLTRLCKFEDGMPVDENVMSSLKTSDREYLQTVLQGNLFGYNLSVEVSCDKCGDVFTGSLNTANFF